MQTWLNRNVARLTTGLLTAMLLLAASATAQTFTQIYSFSANTDPYYFANQFLAQGRDGKLYGTSHFSPASASGSFGTFFSLPTSGPPSILTELNGTTGTYPYGGVTLGADGNFYGTTSLGGTNGFGTVFKVTSAGVLTVLHNFTGGADGSEPISPPVLANDGNYYGVTAGSESASASTLYKITPSGVYSQVHIFTTAEGSVCEFSLLGSDGNLYGGCESGGSSNGGTAYKVSTAGKVTVLHNFTTSDGTSPGLPMAQGSDGNYYGVAYQGGASNFGTVWRVSATGVFKKLHDFTGGADGASPVGGLTLGTDGLLYGAATGGGISSNPACNNNCGVLYKITNAGVLTTLYSFDSTTGSYPQESLMLDTNGKLYSITYSGGAFNNGSFFSLDVGLAAFARLVNGSAKVAAKIGILGQGFSSATVVKFAGVQATTVTRTGSTYLTVTVPTGALSGSVTVTTGATTLTSNTNFNVLPTVASFTPSSGPVGTVVTINGTGLTQTTAVTFNTTVATAFTVISDSQITATVPTGATTGKIKVTTKGGSATSTTSFTVM